MSSWTHGSCNLVVRGTSLRRPSREASLRGTDGSLWLAKIPSMGGRRDVSHWGYFTLQLGRDASIERAPARVLKLSGRSQTFAVGDFDRTPASRRRNSLAMSRLERQHTDGAKYLGLVDVIERKRTSTQLSTKLVRLFRRAWFNILIGTRDDHLRIHDVLRDGNCRQVSPASDVNPNRD